VSRALAAVGTPFVIGSDGHGVTSLRFRGDRFETDYVRAGSVLGRVLARYRVGEAAWHQLDTGAGASEWRPHGVAATVSDPR
jgi:hypothetical protein